MGNTTSRLAAFYWVKNYLLHVRRQRFRIVESKFFIEAFALMMAY